MNYSNNWTATPHIMENIPAAVSSLCNLYGMQISRTTIWEELTHSGKYTDFNEIMHFFNKWKIEHIHLNFAKEHLDEKFFPALLLLNTYITILLVTVDGNNVIYVDPISGWMKASVDELFAKSMGHIVLVEPSNDIHEKDYLKKLKKDENKSLKLQKEINLQVIDNFLSPEECQQLFEAGKSRFTKSQVLTVNGSATSNSRTSSSSFLDRKNSLAIKVQERGSKLLNLPVENFENVQLTAYGPGEFYGTHSDAFQKQKIDPKKGQRIKTILIYLTADYQGGATNFPYMNVKIEPKVGRAVAWSSLDKHGERSLLAYHGGLPVFEGFKCVSNLWILDKNWS